MLENLVTGERREVDVAIRSTIAGHEVIVAVEAMATGRKADSPWVEKMMGKHANLPTSQLVLVAKAGFTAPARALAERERIAAISPADLESDDPELTVVNAIPALWPKTLNLTPNKATFRVEDPVRGLTAVQVGPDHLVFLGSGEPAGNVLGLFNGLVGSNFERVAEQIGLRDISEDRDQFFTLGVGPDWTVEFAGNEERVHLRFEERGEPELHVIDSVEFVGRAIIKVSRIDLTHQKLGQTMFAFGEGKIGDQDATVVVSENTDGGKLTVRFKGTAGP